MQQQTFWMRREQQEYPVLRGRRSADAAVVGGGLTGLTTALWLSRAGLRVAVVEAARLGSGASGCCAGIVSLAGGLCYARLEKRRGSQAAAAYAQTQACKRRPAAGPKETNRYRSRGAPGRWPGTPLHRKEREEKYKM